MKFKDYKEATAFAKALAEAKAAGKRELLGVKFDSTPAWGTDKTEHKLDGSEVEAVYLSYMEATDRQKFQATPAKLAGVKLERISGRLIDVRTCKDGTVQLLLSNGLRDGEGKIAFRGPNVDKGILCALSFGEGLGELVDEIIARVPDEMIAKLKATKAALAPKKGPKQSIKEAAFIDKASDMLVAKLLERKPEAEPEMAPVKAQRGPTIIDVPSVEPPAGPSDETRLKLK